MSRIISMGLFIIIAINSPGQVSTYLFSTDATNYTEISGANYLGDTASEDQFFVDPSLPLGDTTHAGPGLPIGFNFIYNGNTYNVFGVNTNGWIALGNGSVNMRTTSSYFPLSSPVGSNFLAVFARNLQAQDSASIQYTTSGTAPNRELVVQWKNFRKHLNVNDHYNFQIHLYESTNRIEYIYGTVVTNVNASFVSVGMIGNDSTDFNIRSTGSSSSWSSTAAGVLVSATCTLNPSIVPVSGLVFRWEAPAPCSSPPVPGMAVTSFNAVCPNNPFILSIANYSSGPGQTYQWQSSPDSVTWTDIPGATFTTYSTTQANPTWYRCVLTCSLQSASSSPAFVNFNPPTLCYCTTNLGGDCVGYGYIDSVSIVNTTLANFHSGCTNLTAPNFSDYPPVGNHTCTLFRGSTYVMNVTCSFQANISLWIDYNQSGTFDANEWVQVSANETPNIPASISFTVPSNASVGSTKIRLRSRTYSAANGATDACTNFLSGETEDYTIRIDYGVGMMNPVNENSIVRIFPNPISAELKVEWMKDVQHALCRVFNSTGQLETEMKWSHLSRHSISTIGTQELHPGIHLVQLIADDSVTTEKIWINH